MSAIDNDGTRPSYILDDPEITAYVKSRRDFGLMPIKSANWGRVACFALPALSLLFNPQDRRYQGRPHCQMGLSP